MKVVLAAVLLIAIGVFLIPFVTAEDAPKTAVNPDQIKRGEYLTKFGVCHDCHTPKTMTAKGPEPDFSRAFMGHPADLKVPALAPGLLGPDKWAAAGNSDFTAWAGPWGVSFAANLTPDNETGIGTWTEDMFIKAMRTGKHMGEGRDILPPMPWQFIGSATDDDLKAVFVYLKSVKPIHNPVPDPVPPPSN